MPYTGNTISARQDASTSDPWRGMPTPSIIPTPSGYLPPGVKDNTPLSTTGNVLIQAYAFGGLAFMCGIVLSGLCLWLWKIVIKKGWTVSPIDLEVYPAQIAERERIRDERRRRKEEKLREKEKFTMPPVRFNRRSRKASLPTYSAIQSARRPSTAIARVPRKSSLSNPAAPSKGIRVSWADSFQALEPTGKTVLEPIIFNDACSIRDEKGEVLETAHVEPTVKVMLTECTPPSAYPVARLATRRVSTAIDNRAPRGHAMIAVTTPEVAESWAAPERSRVECECGRVRYSGVDPLDDTRRGSCDIHGR